MDNYDDIFKKNFKGEKEAVNAGEESQLWNSIVEELGEDNSIAVAPFSLFSRKSLLIFVAILLLFSAYYIGKEQANKGILSETRELGLKSSIEDVEFDKTELKKSGSENVNNDVENTKAVNSGEILAEQKIDPTKNRDINFQEISIQESSLRASKNQINISDKIVVSEIIDQNQISNNVDLNSTSSNNNQFSNSQEIEQSLTKDRSNVQNKNTVDIIFEPENIPEEINPTEADNTKLDSRISEVTIDITKLKSEELDLRTKVDDGIISTTIQYLKHFLDFDKPKIIENKKADSSLQFSVSVMAGLNKSGLNYSGTNTNLINTKNETERGYYGSNFGLDLGVEYKNTWMFSTGIYYNTQNTIFNIEGTRNNIVYRDTFVSGILIDYSSKEVLEEYMKDSTFITDSYYRTQNINSFKSVVIPIQLGWKRASSRFEYGILVGANARLRLDQSAKLIDINNEIVDLNKDSNLFTNFIDVGFNFSPFLEYRISNQLGLRVAYDVQVYRPTISLDQSLSLINYIHNVKCGLTYRF